MFDADPTGRFDHLLSRLRGETDPGLCGPTDVELGKPVSASLLQQSREMPDKVRIVRQGTPMIMDLRPTRLTIILDDKDLVVSANCG